MLDKLIAEGRLLHDRVQKVFDLGYENLRPEDRVFVAELEGWYSGVTRALEQRFGVDSTQARTWKDDLEGIPLLS